MTKAMKPRGAAWAAAALAAMLAAGMWPAPSTVVAAAPADPILDVEPDVDTVAAGTTVTLTATVFDAAGSVLTGPASNTQVRFYFKAGSANAPDGSGGGNSADLQCHTGQTGSCAVTYVAVNTGVDVICAKTSTGPGACSEAVDAPERADAMDTVQRTVVAGTPSPNSDPSPTPTPVIDPTPTPATSTPTPAPTPTATPAPTPTPTATPAPTPTPTATPAPTRTPAPAPDPTPTPAVPTPTPTTNATSTPTADPSPTADPTPTRAPVTAFAGTTGGGGSDHGTAGGTDATGGPGATGGDGVRDPLVGRPSDGLQGAVDAIVGFAVEGAGRVLQPEAAATVATTFGFPITLAILVLLFLLVQSRMDDRDPKLRSAPRSLADTLVAFEDDVR